MILLNENSIKTEKRPLINKCNSLFLSKKQNDNVDGACEIYSISWTSELGNDGICHQTWIRSVALFKSVHSGDVLARRAAPMIDKRISREADEIDILVLRTGISGLAEWNARGLGQGRAATADRSKRSASRVRVHDTFLSHGTCPCLQRKDS